MLLPGKSCANSFLQQIRIISFKMRCGQLNVTLKVTSSVATFMKVATMLPTGIEEPMMSTMFSMGVRSSIHVQLCSKLFNPPCVFPMISIVNKSCNIECCVNKMFRINKKMIVSRGLELILSVFRRTTISGQHPLI